MTGRKMQMHETMRAEMKPDVYGGPTCEQIDAAAYRMYSADDPYALWSRASDADKAYFRKLARAAVQASPEPPLADRLQAVLASWFNTLPPDAIKKSDWRRLISMLQAETPLPGHSGNPATR